MTSLLGERNFDGKRRGEGEDFGTEVQFYHYSSKIDTLSVFIEINISKQVRRIVPGTRGVVRPGRKVPG